MIIKKSIKDLTQEERLCLLSYDEIYKNFIFKGKNCESSMYGNTFYISSVKKRFRKQKNLLILTCCCGVSVQTMIDILKPYNAIDGNKIIEFEMDDAALNAMYLNNIIYIVSHCEYGDIYKKNSERYIDCFFTSESDAKKYVEEQEKLYSHSFDFNIEKVYKGVVNNE